MNPAAPATERVLGIPLSVTHYEETLDWMDAMVAVRGRGYVCVSAVHTVVAAQDDPELRAAVLGADLVVPDGQPLVWALNALGHELGARVYGPDLMWKACARAARSGTRFFLYGGRDPAALEQLVDRLKAAHPGLAIVGTHCPPFRPLTPAEEERVASEIDASGADVVWVGIGVPKQEKWMARMRPRLAAPVLVGVGAAFDFHAGLIPQAPAWMQSRGLEWLFRLSQEPRRLWRRYARTNPRFVIGFARQYGRYRRSHMRLERHDRPSPRVRFVSSSTPSALSRPYARVCRLEDFSDPAFAELIPSIRPSASHERPHRKDWEFAMAAMFLDDLGRLDETAEVLDVGAGSEEIAFWLACRAARVVAIDIYGQGSFAYREAADAMLQDPASLAPYEYPRDRLEVRSMDARELAFPDASFDVVVSFSSIEHFGTPSDIARSAREIGRVLKPGGHAFIVTEVLVDQHWSDRAPLHFALRLASFGRLARDATTPRLRSIGDQFTRRELRKRIIEPSGLELMQPLDLSMSAQSYDNVIDMNGPEPRPATGAEYPHIVLRSHRSYFTSICLPLVKPR